MKAVLITGAAGFVGMHAVREFVARGWHVFALVHRSASTELGQMAAAGAVRIVAGDVTDERSMREALSAAGGGGVDAIVHCAGRASDVGWRREFRRTNFESVQILGRLARESGVGRFVFVSTTDVYGMRDFGGESEEELEFAACPGNAYPEFKIRAERWIEASLPRNMYAIVRPAQVWGVGDPTLTPRIVAFLRGSPWIVHFGRWRGGNRWPLAHVRNVAAGIYLAAVADEAAGEAINVVDDEVTTVEEWYRMLIEVYLPGKRMRSVTLPRWMGGVFGATVSGVSNVLNLRRPFMDPSLYALASVSSNLDFGNGKLRALMAAAGRSLVTQAEGLGELRQAGVTR